MNKLMLLIRLNLKNTYNINRIARTRPEEKFKTVVMVAIIIFALLSLTLSFGTYAVMMADVLKEAGLLDLLLMLAVVLASILSLFFSMFSAQGMIFKSRDTEMLLSMPIPTWNIFISRAVGVYIGNLPIALLIYVPWYAVYCYYTEQKLQNPMYMLLGVLAATLIPTAVAIVAGYGLSWITAKFKGKSFVTLVFSIALLFGYMYFMQGLPTLLMNLAAQGEGLMGAIAKLYPPSVWFKDAVANGRLSAIIMLVLSAIGAFALVALPIGASFRKIIASLAEGHKRRGYSQEQISAKSSPFAAMLKKDISRYFSSPMYVMNTSVGVILMLILSVSLIFGGTGLLASIIEIPGIESYLGRAVIVLLCATAVLTCTTAPSLSLEAKTLWILKSSPVSAMDVFKSKIALNVLIASPALILSAGIFSLSIKFSAVELAAALVLPTLLSFVVATVGILMNLLFPKLDWTNETVVIKQSMSVLMSMIAGAVVVALPVLLYTRFLYEVISFEAAVLLFALLLGVIFKALIHTLKGYGTRLFEKF